MVVIKNRQLIINGRPQIVLAGEIHYFRLPRDQWEDRILKLKAAHCDTVATYVPWLVHQPSPDQAPDVTGQTKPENDVIAFFDLVHHHQLHLIPRPGPFQMAELKNEGIPHWVYTKHPDAIPIGFQNQKATAATLDLLHPGYLQDVAAWYAAIMPPIADRLVQKGGPVIALQLDNEVGMLDWVTNIPDLSDRNLADFADWLQARHSNQTLAQRYPFPLQDPEARQDAFRNLRPAYSLAFHEDFHSFNRHRIARYFATLRQFAESHNVTDIPFLVNIHGTGEGRSLTYPIGLHQLSEAFTQAPGFLAGSDHYLGELTRVNAADLYLLNALPNAVEEAQGLTDNPLTSLEFEVGTGDYGETGAIRQSPESADHKIRLSLAQGNRLLNYYLLAGGTNPPLQIPAPDGNSRIAFTGERHGFAAPIDPEGRTGPHYRQLTQTNRAAQALAPFLATAHEIHDPLALALQLDDYRTDLKFHQNPENPLNTLVRHLESTRVPLDSLTRILLNANFRFPAYHLTNRPIDPLLNPALLLPTSPVLHPDLQSRLVDYIRSGGKLLLYGPLPTLAPDLQPALQLAQALALQPLPEVQGTPHFFPSLTPDPDLDLADPRYNHPEVRTGQAHPVKIQNPNAQVLFRMTHDQSPVATLHQLEKGQALYFGSLYPAHIGAWKKILALLGLAPALQSNDPDHGTIALLSQTPTSPNPNPNPRTPMLLTLLNLDHEPKTLHPTFHDQPLLPTQDFPEGITLAPRESRFVPLGIETPLATILASTAELVENTPSRLTFRATAHPALALLQPHRRLDTSTNPDGLVRLPIPPYSERSVQTP